MTPITDFEAVYPQDGDIPSELDVFNNANIERQIREKMDYIKKEISAVKSNLANEEPKEKKKEEPEIED